MWTRSFNICGFAEMYDVSMYFSLALLVSILTRLSELFKLDIYIQPCSILCRCTDGISAAEMFMILDLSRRQDSVNYKKRGRIQKLLTKT